MNTRRSPRGRRLLIGIFGLLLTSTSALSQTEDIPQGTLHVDRNLIRAGVNSQTDWNIAYPSGITEIIEIVPKRNVRMKASVLGVAFQSGRNLPSLDAHWSKNDCSWKRFLYGTGTEVNPDQVMFNKRVKENDRIDSGGKVTIGERDLIILWEDSTARPETTYLDMQDLVVLLNFE